MLVKSQRAQPLSHFVASGPAGNSKETASDKLEEGGDDVKSSWPLTTGLHTCYNGIYKKRPREQADLIKYVVVGLESATRLHEVGIASIVDQNATVNTFPGAHASRHGVGYAKEGNSNFGRGAYHCDS